MANYWLRKNLVKDFAINSNALKQPMMRAINDVSFKMYKSRGLSVVGESGSGKSTTAKMIAKMYAPTSGVIEYKGRDIQDIVSRDDLMHYREGVQMVWQDPFGSLNPTHTIFHHIARPLLIHKKVTPGNKKSWKSVFTNCLNKSASSHQSYGREISAPTFWWSASAR